MQASNLSFVLKTTKCVLALNALGAFFFDFVLIGSAPQKTFRGFDLVLGINSPHDTAGLAPSFWAVMLLVVCVLQLAVVSFWRNRIAQWCMVVVAILILVLLQLDFIALWQSQGVTVLFGYWMAFGFFLLIAICHAADDNLKRHKKVGQHDLHINIFTQRKED